MDKLEILQKKILNSEQNLLQILSYWRFKNFRIVFTNGCFDILHRGHIEYLAKAASMGDILIVGLNTDASVQRLKGPTRPLQDLTSRSIMLASLGFVNAVVPFDEDTPLELIRIVKPDILVKGGDYSEENIVGASFVKSYGGSINIIDFVDGYSSTNIINRLIK